MTPRPARAPAEQAARRGIGRSPPADGGKARGCPESSHAPAPLRPRRRFLADPPFDPRTPADEGRRRSRASRAAPGRRERPPQQASRRLLAGTPHAGSSSGWASPPPSFLGWIEDSKQSLDAGERHDYRKARGNAAREPRRELRRRLRLRQRRHHRRTCAAGSSCSCDLVGDQEYACPGGDLEVHQAAIPAACQLSCAGGGCNVTCANVGNCNTTCTGDDCQMTRSGAKPCSRGSCAAPSMCTKRCNNGGRCT